MTNRSRREQDEGVAALISLAKTTSSQSSVRAVHVSELPARRLFNETTRRFLNFAVGGAAIAALGAVILAILVHARAGTLVAQAVQLTVTLVLNFLYNYMVTWRSRPRHELRKQLGLFVVTRGTTQTASWIGFAALTRGGMDYQIANVICLVAVTIVNFITSDRIVFRTSREVGSKHNVLNFARRRHDRFRGLRAGDNIVRAAGPSHLAPRKTAPGALNGSYEVPTITFKRNEALGLLLSSLFIAGWVTWHLGWEPLVLIGCAFPSIAFRGSSWIMSWFDRPSVVRSDATRRRLESLFVTVAVPVYNEDPGLLDRCIWALVNQSRQPQVIWVVDDGSSTDYSKLRRHWERHWLGGTEVRWTRQDNQGKRCAHAFVFESDANADIFITVDSDTTLEYHAIEEGLKPFQSRRVMSVAGIEMGFNAYTNFLTRLQCSLQLFAQAVIGGAWSYAGDMYTNRGPFALYRSTMVRDFLPIYRKETFFGRRVILGDDSLLALCASARGRSVQQLTAFGLTMWPENFSHHVRQRVRWARGRAVRNFWRTRYRPVMSYCWWFTVSGIYDFLLSVSLIVVLVATWPSSAAITLRLGIAMVLLSIPNSLRTLCFHRSDETLADRIGLALIRPIAAVWSSIVLSRLVRVWGTATLLRQGWTTRQNGAELVLDPVPVLSASVPSDLVRVPETA